MAQFPGGGSPGGGGFPSPGGGGYRPPTGGGNFGQPSGGRFGNQPTYPQPSNPYGSQPSRNFNNNFGNDGFPRTPTVPDPRPSPFSSGSSTSSSPNRSGPRRYDPTSSLPGPQFGNPFYRSESPFGSGQPRFGHSPETRIYSGSFSAQGGAWQQASQLSRGGDVARARGLIDAQLSQNRSLENLMSAVNTLETSGAGRANYQPYRQEALNLALQQTRSGASQPLPWVAVAKFSLEDNDDAAFRAATSALVTKFPDDKHSAYFQGIAAVKDGEWQQAERHLERAKELGVPAESINVWLKMAIDNQRWVWQYATIIFWIVVAWLGGLAVLYVVGRMLSSLTLRTTKKASFIERPQGQRWLRACYRQLINIAGIYYYLSLPVLIIVSIALPLAVCYALLHVPVVSIWLIALVLLVSIGSILTACSAVRACFVSLDGKIPGRTLAGDEHPRLWQLVRSVAERVGTRPVDTIILVPSADIAVVERGSFLTRLRDRGERVLILGAGLLEGFSERALCSVLAHEYGHFLHRDTAGGGMALRVNEAMHNFADAIMARGRVAWWHLATHFLRFYYGLFNRITFGASRLQEIMADRVAVTTYGPAALEEGLRHAIRRSLEFSYWTSRRLEAVLRNEAGATAFVQTAERPEIGAFEDIESALNELIHRPTNEADTHPSPQDRFKLAKRLNIADAPTDGKLVWALLDDPRTTLQSAGDELQRALSDEAKLVKSLNAMKLDYLNQVIRHQPSDEAFHTRAAVHLEQGDFAAAQADLDRVLKSSPQSIDARLGKSLVYFQAKQFRPAAQLLAQMLADLPAARSDGTYFLLAECHTELDELPQAESALQQALGLREDSPGARLALGRVRARSGKHQDAIELFTAVIERFPHSADAYVDRALAHEALGHSDAALADLRRAASLGVVYPRAQRELARTLLAHAADDPNSLTVALHHARQACAATLGLAESLPVLVDALVAHENWSGAAEAIDELLLHLPPDQQPHWREQQRHFRDHVRHPAALAAAANPS